MRKLLNLKELPASPSPSPSPYTAPLDFSNLLSRENIYIFKSVPIHTIAIDLVTICSIAAVVVLSGSAFGAIFNLLLKSRRAPQLRHFNSLWTVRSLLVTFAFFWAVNEILRLPLVRKNHLYPFSLSTTLEQQSNVCKVHVVLSLGILEPGFLITLFFLIRVSVKKRKPRKLWSLVFILTLCLPLILLQIFFVYFYTFDGKILPRFMHMGSSFLSRDSSGNKIVLCTYPFISWVVFAAFAGAYAVAFMVSFWRVLAFVINKGIGYRMNVLAATVMVAVLVQIVGICLSWLWAPDDVAYGCVVLAVFLCFGACVAVGEVILVIRPIGESLEAGGDCCRWSPDDDSRRPV